MNAPLIYIKSISDIVPVGTMRRINMTNMFIFVNILVLVFSADQYICVIVHDWDNLKNWQIARVADCNSVTNFGFVPGETLFECLIIFFYCITDGFYSVYKIFRFME